VIIFFFLQNFFNMKNIEISEKLKKIYPAIALYCIDCEIVVSENTELLWLEIEKRVAVLEKNLKTSDLPHLKPIEDSRSAYRAFGKEPARYRLSAEALLRRIIQGKGLYKINNIVDITNYISLMHYFSIGTYDSTKIEGNVTFTQGTANEEYNTIGRGIINIENLPVFADSIGSFGNPTSDSARTCIQPESTKMLMSIISFGGNYEELTVAGEFAVDLLKKYATAKNISTKIVE